MDINKITKINGKYIESKEVNVSSLETERTRLQERKSMLSKALQDHTDEVTQEKAELDIHIAKIDTLLQ